MKNFLILTAVLTVIFVAIIDTKARIEELDDIATTTPAQMEMKTDINKSTGSGIMQKYESSQPPNSQNQIEQKINPLQNPQNQATPHPNKNFEPFKNERQMP